MNTLGSLSTERNRDPWIRAVADRYLPAVAVGILSGIVVACVRTPIHLPGHKAIFWMAPVLATRLMTRTAAGALVGAMVTAVTTLVLGGRIAGGITMIPLVILAGIVLDMGAQFVERRQFAWWQSILFLALVGIAANLICFVKRLFDPLGTFFSVGNLDDLLFAGGLHSAFGFLAALLGAGVGYGLLRFRPIRKPR